MKELDRETKGFQLVCPGCSHPQTCPCHPCQKRKPSDKPWIWSEEDIICGGCGLKRHMEWWFDESTKQRKGL